MPFRIFEVAEYFPEQVTLRRAFSKLTALETFCSVRDELYLDLVSPITGFSRENWRWSIWPNLKTLALYNQDVSGDGFWEDMGKLRSLETLVLTRTDGLEEVDIKAEWRKACGDEKRGLHVVLVNVQSHHRVPMGCARWKDEDKVRVREVNVPTSYYGDDDPIDLCQDWVKRRMLRGEPPAEWT